MDGTINWGLQGKFKTREIFYRRIPGTGLGVDETINWVAERKIEIRGRSLTEEDHGGW